ncbi:MAG: hypothetical protein ACE144_00355 [Thermodesulfobacteriota bacterium]
MLNIMIVNDESLGPSLGKLKIGQEGRDKYIILGERNDNKINLLEQKGFQKIVHLTNDPSYKNRFLKEYIDLIGLLGREYNGQRWWATDISSKNRFTSKIPFLLNQFLTAVEAIEKEDYDNLIILNPSWEILNSLREVLKKKNVRFVCVGDHYAKWKELLLSWCRMILLTLYNASIILVRAYWVKKKLGEVLKKSLPAAQANYVIKTFVYDHSFSETGIYRDIFFGSLLDHLKEERQVLVFGNILGDFKRCIRKISQCTSQVIIPIEAFLSPMSILNALVQVLLYKVKVRKKMLFFGYDVSNIIRNELSRTYNGIDFYQFLHYWSTQKLLQTLPVETFLLTYENNPWEKMCMMAIRKYSPDTNIIGYQHTVVPQASANMFVSQHEKDVLPMPDRILTVGEAPKEIMERYGSYDKGKIEPSCGLRFEYLFHSPISKRKKTGHILVVLEGILDVYKMVNYVVRELKGNHQYDVTIRTHPVLPFDHFKGKLTCNLNDVSNFRVSSNASLKDDIDWADMVLYWGSTVALEALSMGKPVIHYQMDSILSYDPLFDCKHLKWVLSEKESLAPAIEEIYSLSDERFEEEQAKARQYLSRYFHPVAVERLEKFLVKS